jgi:glycosyltransferase involved in cell wall biosynthesis
MKLSLVVPVYNEASHLSVFLEKIDSLSLPCDKEIIFINDASKDNSLEILNSYNFTTSSVIILNQNPNQGKGSAIRKGIERATGDFIIIQDADFEYEMNEIPSLIEPLLKNKADVVYGSRFRKEGHQVHRTFHYLVNRILTLISNLFSGLYVSDMETCYKVFKSEIIKNINLESNRFGFEPEVTAKIARLKIRVEEYPISYFPRNYLEGKKITWKDGIAALWHLFYFNFLSSKKSFFKKDLPEHYIPKGSNWL